MRTQIVAGFLGRMFCSFALVMLIPLLYAIVQQEEAYQAYIISALITGLFGLGLLRYGETAGHIGIREGFLIVAGTWLLTGFFGAFPYWLSGWVPSFLCALFESVSGFTTTGATVITDVEMLPKSLLLWRSLTHWLGGMGIIVLFLVFLTNLGADAVHLFRAEMTGPTVHRVMPRIRHVAKILWLMYVGFTVVEIVLLYLAGMNLFDAVNHAFSTMATGGFSTRNTSIKYYDSLPIEIILNFFMFMAGGSFALYYLAWKKGWRKLVQDTEFKLYFAVVISTTLIIAGFLYTQASVPLTTGLRDALFTVIAVITSTGFVTADFDTWPPVAKMILFVLMFFGGCAGSTAGGIKLIRIIILMKDAIGSLLRAVHPKIIRTVKVGKKPVDFTVLHTILQFFFLYMVIFFLSAIVISATGIEPLEAISAAATTLGNVGPGFGSIGPTTHFAAVPPFAKIVLIINMFLGRLELFTLLVLLHPEFWQPYMTRRTVGIIKKKVST